MPVIARAWNASGTRPGGAPARCGLRPDALELLNESRTGARAEVGAVNSLTWASGPQAPQ